MTDAGAALKERGSLAIRIGDGVRFQRVRRITGYLVGTTDRFNNAKRAEERDRVKHLTEKDKITERDAP
jgi:ribonucleoside-triphosphate reductase